MYCIHCGVELRKGTTRCPLCGTDYEQVVDADLNLYQPVVDTTVKVSFKIENKENGSYRFKEIPVTVPGEYETKEGDNAAPDVCRKSENGREMPERLLRMREALLSLKMQNFRKWQMHLQKIMRQVWDRRSL